MRSGAGPAHFFQHPANVLLPRADKYLDPDGTEPWKQSLGGIKGEERSMESRMTIGSKITLLAASLMAMSLILGVLSLVSLSRVGSGVRTLAKDAPIRPRLNS